MLFTKGIGYVMDEQKNKRNFHSSEKTSQMFDDSIDSCDEILILTKKTSFSRNQFKSQLTDSITVQQNVLVMSLWRSLHLWPTILFLFVLVRILCCRLFDREPPYTLYFVFFSTLIHLDLLCIIFKFSRLSQYLMFLVPLRTFVELLTLAFP